MYSFRPFTCACAIPAPARAFPASQDGRPFLYRLFRRPAHRWPQARAAGGGRRVTLGKGIITKRERPHRLLDSISSRLLPIIYRVLAKHIASLRDTFATGAGAPREQRPTSRYAHLSGCRTAKGDYRDPARPGVKKGAGFHIRLDQLFIIAPIFPITPTPPPQNLLLPLGTPSPHKSRACGLCSCLRPCPRRRAAAACKVRAPWPYPLTTRSALPPNHLASRNHRSLDNWQK